MSCTGPWAMNPVCLVGAVAANATAGVADSAFSRISGWFGLAAQTAATWLWRELDAATTLDLNSPGLRTQLAATGAIATVLCLGLFLIQVITSALRREPGGLGRAVTGLLVSFVGSALALAATQALLAAVDALSAGLLSYTLHTNMSGLGQKLAVTHLAAVQNPAIGLLLSVVIIAAVVIVWAAMTLRKVMLLIAAVLAPLAFAGATADITRGWVRKWAEFVAAMVVSKLLLVIILGIGLSLLDGAGQSGSGVTQSTTQLAGGALVLLLGGLSPWIAIRMFHFAGDTLYAAHLTTGHATTGARAAIAAPQKVAAISSQVRAASSIAAAPRRLSSAGSATAQGPGQDVDGSPRPAPPGDTAIAGRGGAAGAVGSAGGAAAAATPAAPVVAGVAAAQTGISAGRAGANAAKEAATSAADSAQPSSPRPAVQAPHQRPQQAPPPNPRSPE
jgi:type IV secretion system protein TrbL